MYEETEINLTLQEIPELYILLASHNRAVDTPLEGLFQRLERHLYMQRSIDEMEKLIDRAQKESR